jgi:hypothetical protein
MAFSFRGPSGGANISGLSWSAVFAALMVAVITEVDPGFGTSR